MKINTRKLTICVILLLFIFIIISITYVPFHPKRPSPYKYPFGIVDSLRARIKNGKLPQDLTELGIWEDKIRPCPPTTEVPPDKWLILYNPNYKKDEFDWVVVLGYDFQPRHWLLSPLVFWNNGQMGTLTKLKKFMKEFVNNRTDLKYYYLNAERISKVGN